MTKYLLNRIIRGLVSVVIVVAVIMFMVYTCLNRDTIFASDPTYSHLKSHAKLVYKYQIWEKYGYLDYVSYEEYLQNLVGTGDITPEKRDVVVKFGETPADDTPEASEYVKKFSDEYEEKGYTIIRKDASFVSRSHRIHEGGEQRLFAYKDINLFVRLWEYFKNLITVDNIHYVKDDVGERGIKFTMHDPVYGGEKLSPAIIGNGTRHKYLLYVDSRFPYVHQNLIKISLGTSYSVNKDIDIFDTMTTTQGADMQSMITYPSGLREKGAEDLHSATYISGSLEKGTISLKRQFTDNYTNTFHNRSGYSKIGYSFTIGIISVLLSYLMGIPLGVLMARKKDKLVDRLGTFYIIFIIAVPSLAYIFMFRTIGTAIGLPGVFDTSSANKLMYVLPVVSLALPAAAGLMKWLRRYMIDQMNSDYVRFARSGGLSEGEIFRKHILKNAIIPIVHGIPANILGALVGAIITERVYVVPGAGNLLVKAIENYDNGVIVGVALFYALLSVVSILLGDILMSILDPRISFVPKER